MTTLDNVNTGPDSTWSDRAIEAWYWARGQAPPPPPPPGRPGYSPERSRAAADRRRQRRLNDDIPGAGDVDAAIRGAATAVADAAGGFGIGFGAIAAVGLGLAALLYFRK